MKLTFLNHKHSEESKLKMSKTRKMLFRKGIIIPTWKGKKFSKFHCKRISETRRKLFAIGDLTINYDNNRCENLSKGLKRAWSDGKFDNVDRKAVGLKISKKRKIFLSEPEERERLSIATKNAWKSGKFDNAKFGIIRGEEHPLYIHDCTKRVKMRLREKYLSCQICRMQSTNEKLTVHRLNPSGKYVENNCICLCRKCHNGLHFLLKHHMSRGLRTSNRMIALFKRTVRGDFDGIG